MLNSIDQNTGNNGYQESVNPILADPGLKALLQQQISIRDGIPPAGTQAPAMMPAGGASTSGPVAPPITLPEKSSPNPSFPAQPSVNGPTPNEARLSSLQNSKPALENVYHKITSSDFGQDHPALGKIAGILGQIPATAADLAMSLKGVPVLGNSLSSIGEIMPGTTEQHNEQLGQAGSAVAEEEANRIKESEAGSHEAQGEFYRAHAQQITPGEFPPEVLAQHPEWGGLNLTPQQQEQLVANASTVAGRKSVAENNNQTKLDLAKPIQGADGAMYRIDPNNPGIGIPLTTPDGKPIVGTPKPVDIKKQLQNGVKKAMDEGNGPEAERLMQQLKAIDPLGWENATSRQTMAGASASRASTARAQLGLNFQKFGFDQEKFYNPQPVGAERTKGDLANSAVARSVRMEDIVDGHPEIFGPGAGRATKIKEWLGSQSPDAQLFLTDRVYLNDHSAAVFGGRGKYILHDLNAIDDPKMNPAALHTSLEEARKTAQGFVEAGTVHHGPQDYGNGSQGGKVENWVRGKDGKLVKQ
jgi:hypothetical protein